MALIQVISDFHVTYSSGQISAAITLDLMATFDTHCSPLSLEAASSFVPYYHIALTLLGKCSVSLADPLYSNY